MAQREFSSVVEFIPGDEDESGWPVSANHLWWRTAEYMQERGQSFLFLEPDVVPLRATFCSELFEEYSDLEPGSILARGRQAMFFEGQKWVQMSGAPSSMDGIAIFPATTFEQMSGYDYKGPNTFNGACFKKLKDRCSFTKLIHGFRSERWRIEDVERIPAECSLWHSCKDGSLIDVLRLRTLGLSAAAAFAFDGGLDV